MKEFPDFKRAWLSFSDFLKDNNLGTNIFWLLKNDTIYSKNKLYVYKKNLIQDNNQVERLYNKAKQDDIGIEWCTLGYAGDVTIVYVYIPKDNEDAELRMIDGFKMSILESAKCVLISNSIIWRVLKLFFAIRGTQNFL